MEFHGITCNCWCQRIWRIPSSMDFHEIRGTTRVSEIGALEVPRISMEFHGTARVSEIGAIQVPWNSMEFCPDPKFHGIPRNFIHFSGGL